MLNLREVGEHICCIADRFEQLDQRGAFDPEAPEDGPLGFANVVTRRAKLAVGGIVEPSGEVRDGQLVWVLTELDRMMGALRDGREN